MFSSIRSFALMIAVLAASTAAHTTASSALTPPSLSIAKLSGAQALPLVRTGARPLGGSSARPAFGYTPRHGHRRHRASPGRWFPRNGAFFGGRQQGWFKHHSWFNGEPRRLGSPFRPDRATGRPLGPTVNSTAPSTTATPGPISGNPSAGVTLQQKAFTALARQSYPSALPRKPRVRHVNRDARPHRAVPRPHVRWSHRKGARRNTAMSAYIRRF